MNYCSRGHILILRVFKGYYCLDPFATLILRYIAAFTVHTLVACLSEPVQHVLSFIVDKAFITSGIYHRTKVRFVIVKDKLQITFKTFRQCHGEFYITRLIDV